MGQNIPFFLDGKTILITGASSGIGRQCAISCCQMGAKVILIARREDKLTETINLLRTKGNLYYVFDVTRYQEIDSLIAGAVKETGQIFGLIHCAGIELTQPFSLTLPQHYQDLFATNVIAGFEFARVISKKRYIVPEGGSFVFISSIMGISGSPSLVGYSSSKGAISSGVRSMALELAPRKIRVNAVSPGHLKDTEMSAQLSDTLGEEFINSIENSYPLGLGSTIDIALSCVYLLSDAAKWITGTNLIIDGGYCAK